jgi:hypothetical protein
MINKAKYKIGSPLEVIVRLVQEIMEEIVSLLLRFQLFAQNLLATLCFENLVTD